MLCLHTPPRHRLEFGSERRHERRRALDAVPAYRLARQAETAMFEQSTPTRYVDYEGFEIHVLPVPLSGDATRFT